MSSVAGQSIVQVYGPAHDWCPYPILEEIASILCEEIGAIKVLISAERELKNSFDLGVEERKNLAISMRDWATSSIWAIWNWEVEERLKSGSKSRLLSSILERFIFFDSPPGQRGSAPQIGRLLGGLRKALKKVVDGEVPFVNARLQGYFQQFLQMQDSAALRKVQLFQRVMRSASTQKHLVLDILSQWHQRALLTRWRQPLGPVGVEGILQNIEQNIRWYVSQLEELTLSETDNVAEASDVSTSATESAGEESAEAKTLSDEFGEASFALQAPGGPPEPVALPAVVVARRRWADLADDESDGDLW
ncbi:unnamed protein product [Durusdinium trenchii]|uniref:Uncharacterized protein n=1 Tax=Durusdinium trenchii TaxID=1381693 RepID=A0ABP0RX02_9DINO